MKTFVSAAAVVFLLAVQAGIPAPQVWAATAIDFERYSAGAVLLREYESLGAVFPRDTGGVEVVTCPPGATVCRARSGQKFIRSQFRTEFERYPLTIEFTAPQRSVSVYVRNDARGTGEVTATLNAYDERGRPAGSATARFGSNEWRQLRVSGAEAKIRRAVLTGGFTGVAPVGNFLAMDDLAFEGEAAPPVAPPTGQAPSLRFVEPLDRARFERVIQIGGGLRLPAVRFRLEVQASAPVVRLRQTTTRPDGRTIQGDVCGGLASARCPSRAPSFDFVLEFQGDPDLPGDHSVRAEATDDRGRSGNATVRFKVVDPEVPGVDLWVMGVEYTQAWQDIIYTDLKRRPGLTGFVPLRDPSGRDTELALPIIPGKPMVVRVYVGLRSTPAAPASGVRVTGQLLVGTGVVGEIPRTIRPLESSNCSDHLGRRSGQSCQRVITVYPSLGRRGPNTNSEYDWDLVDQRSHWEGTLNFVVPPDLTSRVGSGGGLIIRAIVESADTRRETQPGDNEFELQLQNVARPNPLPIRLVRVGMPGFPAPTRAAADRALADVLKMTPFDRVNVVSDRAFSYNGAKATIKAGPVKVKTLDQCQTLWVKLYEAFGLNRDHTLLALTPAGIKLEGCGGLGWKIPDVVVVGKLTYKGGIALSRMPAYSGDSPGDWGRLTTLAQEVYHAHLDRRHVSNYHGEASGCPLQGVLADIIEFFTEIDADCWKPAAHPHGAIGSYPATEIEIGFPGRTTMGHRAGVVYGNLGGTGVRIEPEGPSWRLTLYDPCPTGPINRVDPLATIRQRVDTATVRYRCTLDDDTMVPHDFMSYADGSNRWGSIQRLPGMKMFGSY